MEEVNVWFLSQVVESEVGEREEIRKKDDRKRWPFPWLKCNTALVWDKNRKVAGCSWVLRNHEVVVLLHSRRSFFYY